MRIQGWFLAAAAFSCAQFCHGGHLYFTGFPHTRRACRCCDRDGCDVVERTAPRPMVITLEWASEHAPASEAEEREDPGPPAPEESRSLFPRFDFGQYGGEL